THNSSSRLRIWSPRSHQPSNSASRSFCFFFFNDTATTEIYTLSLHDALPILRHGPDPVEVVVGEMLVDVQVGRSEEHTSELQSHLNLVCRLLLEKKKR